MELGTATVLVYGSPSPLAQQMETEMDSHDGKLRKHMHFSFPDFLLSAFLFMYMLLHTL